MTSLRNRYDLRQEYRAHDFMLASAAIELPEVEVALGDEGPHPEFVA
jgi:hypothetical protein